MKRVPGVLAILVVLVSLQGCSPRPEEAGGAGAAIIATATPQPSRAEAKLEGRILFSKGKGLWLWNGGSTKQLTKDGAFQQPSWSADGKKIAYVRLEGDYSDVWVMNASGGDASNLTRFGRSGADTWGFAPRWSPDGGQIAYLSDQSTYDLALWLMRADGSGKRQLTFMNDYLGGIDGPAWHPKGDRITFTAYRTGKAQIWTLTLANARWQQVTDLAEGAYDAQWDAAGEALAFVSRENGRSDVWVAVPPDDPPLKITRDGLSRSPSWSPDGKTLAFLSGQGGTFDLWSVAVERTPEGPIRLGAPKRVTQGLGADPGGGLSWTK